MEANLTIMPSFGSKARSAVIWNTGFNLFRDFLQFGTMLVLVRMLKPESYGQFAMVTSIMGFLSIFSHSNFIAHIIQVKEESEARYQEHFTASAVLQGGIFLLTNFVAFSLQWVPTYESLEPFLHVMSISFLLEWPYELRRRMLERQFDWKKLRLLQAIGLIISAVLALIMAWMGAGTYTLLVPGLLVTLPFIYDLFVTEGWRPTWAWSWGHYQPAWRFGLERTVGGLAVRSRQLMESSILSAVAGFAMLGIFNRSIGLAQMFCQKFSEQLLTAIYPILSRIEVRDGDPTRIGGLVLRIIAWVAIPIAVIFSELSVPIVHTVYGNKWVEVTPLLPWAMALGALSAITYAAYVLLLSKHQTRLCTFTDLGMLLGTGAALIWVLPYGLAVYLGVAGGLQLLAISVMSQWLRRLHALSWSGIANAFLPPLLASLSAWVIANSLLSRLLTENTASVIHAVGWGAAFSFFYVVTLRVSFKRQLADLVNYLPARNSIYKLLALKIQS